MKNERKMEERKDGNKKRRENLPSSTSSNGKLDTATQLVQTLDEMMGAEGGRRHSHPWGHIRIRCLDFICKGPGLSRLNLRVMEGLWKAKMSFYFFIVFSLS